MKKKVMIISILMCLAIVIAGIQMMKMQEKKTYSFNEIVNKQTPRIQFVEDENGVQEDVNERIKNLENASYKIYKGELGNTARRRLIFKDANGSVLFVITDIGNRGIIEVELDEKSTFYQKETNE